MNDKPVRTGQLVPTMLREPSEIPQTPWHMTLYAVELSGLIKDSMKRSVELVRNFRAQR